MKEHTVHAHSLAIQDQKLGHTGKGDKSSEMNVVRSLTVKLLQVDWKSNGFPLTIDGSINA